MRVLYPSRVAVLFRKYAAEPPLKVALTAAQVKKLACALWPASKLSSGKTTLLQAGSVDV